MGAKNTSPNQWQPQGPVYMYRRDDLARPDEVFPANRGLSGGEKMRERRERLLPAPGKFFDVPSSAILDETKPVLKYRFFVTLVTHLLRMSRFIDCWNHCEPTLQTGLPRSRFT